MFKVGDKVRITQVSNECDRRHGSTLTMFRMVGETHIIDNLCDNDSYSVCNYLWTSDCFELVEKATEPEPRFKAHKYSVPVAETEREKEIVKLVNRVKHSKFKATAIKVEMEGRIGRKGMLRSNQNANDFMLEYLSQFGLARKRRKSDTFSFNYSTRFVPQLPLVFSKIYNDQETEWTFTIMLDNPENALLLRNCIDAFNELKKANGSRSIQVEYAGMHMSFLQDTNGLYPASIYDESEFLAFQNSATQLLPALFFASANIKKKGKTITRAIGCRNANISTGKYNAIHYYGGALEYRVFDTSYSNREHILDNVAFMAKMTANYWGVRKPVKASFSSFGSYKNTGYDINDWFEHREHIVALNYGLKCIKPSYLKIRDMKKQRNFTKSLRTVS